MRKFTQIVERANDTYDYGCVMLYFNFPEIVKVHNAIDPGHLYEEESDRTYGIEDEPHVTLLYGLHSEVTVEQIKEIVSNFNFSGCTIYNASLFKNEKYDVLKFDAKGSELVAANKSLTELPHTTDYPDYHPHMTIAYLKPGSGDKYTNMLKGQKFELTPQYIVFSQPDGTKNEIKIN